MAQIRLSIAGAMVLVLFMALAMASLLNGSSPLWASGMFMLAITLMSTAILGAVAGHVKSRMTWMGVAVFGWVYLGIVFGPLKSGNNTTIPSLPTMAVYEYILYHSTIPRAKADYQGVHFHNANQSESLLHDPSGVGKGPVVRVDVMDLKRIVHSLGAILFAGLGGFVGRLFSSRNPGQIPDT